jgi:hypothetical protein
MPQDIIQYLPFISSLVGTLLGGAVTWGVAKTKLENLVERHTALDRRVGELERVREKDAILMADRIARIEVKLDDIRAHIKESKHE